MNSILIVEDTPGPLLALKDFFTRHGWEVDTASDGEGGLHKATNNGYDVMLLDIRLPGVNGLEICQAVRDLGLETPVIMMTAWGDEETEVRALRKLGASDYVVKGGHTGLSLPALLVRAEKEVHRTKGNGMYRFGAWEVDLDAQRVSSNGVPEALSPVEYRLLKCFVSHPGAALTREKIAIEVWGAQFTRGDVEPRTVDRHVTTLRKKIGAQHIATVVGVGYRFDPEVL
jgi:two-component system response regulator ResD